MTDYNEDGSGLTLSKTAGPSRRGVLKAAAAGVTVIGASSLLNILFCRSSRHVEWCCQLL